MRTKYNTYKVEVSVSGRKIYEVKNVENEDVARKTAQERHEQNAPIDLVHESCVITEVKILNGDDE